MEKNFDLLRPFDPEKAKVGEAICWSKGSMLTYLYGPDVDGDISVVDHRGRLQMFCAEMIRMAPLCWVEGKPVYKGDVLYCNENGEITSYASESYDDVRDAVWWRDGGKVGYVIRSYLTWTPPAKPKVKKEGWVNVYWQEGFRLIGAHVYHSEEIARQHADASPSAYKTAQAHIEWEE